MGRSLAVLQVSRSYPALSSHTFHASGQDPVVRMKFELLKCLLSRGSTRCRANFCLPVYPGVYPQRRRGGQARLGVAPTGRPSTDTTLRPRSGLGSCAGTPQALLQCDMKLLRSLPWMFFASACFEQSSDLAVRGAWALLCAAGIGLATLEPVVLVVVVVLV